MNRPSFNIDKFNVLGSSQNKVDRYISLLEIRTYAPNSEISTNPSLPYETYMVRVEDLGKFFTQMKPRIVYLDTNHNDGVGMFKIVNETSVRVRIIK